MPVGIVEEILVGLIAKDQQVLLQGQTRHGRQFFFSVNPARWIVGVVDDNHLGARGHVFLQLLVADVVLLLLAEWHGDGHTLGQLHLLAEADPRRLEHQRFVSRPDVGVDGLVQPHLAARSNQDIALGINGAAIVGGQLRGHGLEQLR